MILRRTTGRKRFTLKNRNPDYIQCPVCKGHGELYVTANPPLWRGAWLECGLCQGEGKLSRQKDTQLSIRSVGLLTTSGLSTVLKRS